MQGSKFFHAVTIASFAVFAHAAQADNVTEVARVDKSQFPDSVYVKGSGSTRPSGLATGDQVYWFNAADSSRGAALGTSSDRVLASAGMNVKPYNTDPEYALGNFSVSSTDYPNARFGVDMGSRLLTSDRAGMQVTNTMLQVVDFGNAGSNTVHYDFQIGLWDGANLTMASAMSQLNFTLSYGSTSPVDTGFVTYLGNNVFRFTETGAGTGTTLSITSALSGSYVRSLAVTTFGNDTGGAFANDFLGVTASRTLSPVPEPASAALMGVGGLLGLLRLWRRKMQGAAQA